MRPPVRPTLRWIGLLLLSLATLEIAARADDFLREGAPLLGAYSLNGLTRPGAFGREGVPGARYAKWRMNRLGYRGPEVPPGRTAVLAYGASETFGLHEGPDREFPRVLEADLDAWQPGRYSVVNIALPGLRIGRVGYLAQAIERTRAAYVVIYPSPANAIGLTAPVCLAPAGPVANPDDPAGWFRFPAKLAQRVRSIAPPMILDAARQLAIRWATRDEPPMQTVPQATLDAFREDMRCVVRTVRERGAAPILATHASYFGGAGSADDRRQLTAWRRYYPALREDGLVDLERRANDLIRSVAAEQGVVLADAAREIPGGPSHFADFAHFNDAGAARMARLIANTVARAAGEPAP